MYKLNDEFFTDHSDNRYIFVNQESGLFYGLSSSGSMILTWMLAGSNIDDVTEALLKIPFCPTDIKERINTMVNDLLDVKIILKTDNQANEVPEIDLSDNYTQIELQDDRFNTDLVVSDDIEQLLLNDPVHEVSEGGWVPNMG